MVSDILTAYGVNNKLENMKGTAAGFAPLDASSLIPHNYMYTEYTVRLDQVRDFSGITFTTMGHIRYIAIPNYHYNIQIKVYDVLKFLQNDNIINAVVVSTNYNNGNFIICAISYQNGRLCQYIYQTDSTYRFIVDIMQIPTIDYVNEISSQQYLSLSDVADIRKDLVSVNDASIFVRKDELNDISHNWEPLYFDYETTEVTSLPQNVLEAPSVGEIVYSSNYKKFFCKVKSGASTYLYYGRWDGCEKFGKLYGSGFDITKTPANWGIQPFPSHFYINSTTKAMYMMFPGDVVNGLRIMCQPS